MLNIGILFFSVLLGAQFLLSGWTKFKDYNTFRQILINYSLPKIFQHQITGYLIVIYEIFIAVCLLSLQRWLIWLGFILAVLFVISANILLFKRLRKGEKQIKCGCGENLQEEESTVFLLIRNNLLLLVLLFGLLGTIPTVSFFSQTTLTFYLTGIGLLAIIKLFFAGLKAIGILKQWKAFG